ncbi:CMGC protein kinase [Pyricularia oryzae 70-15]|uniref:CMGC protein kinase n=1 Tax=Pyricularia oryzae (strain 70-15 / ATCC MYA-4617 / FGSC 8958) TaxID=242507 RepID=G4NBF6_PYRO7|nr:CMGC protein kinase [Pyricularia oryzae 70-15]EHA48913.1 CMGC protein kinase [Pyricularia oryzae 70-15]
MFTRRIPRFYCVFQVRTGTLRRISYQTLRQLHPSLRSIPIACPSRAASGNAIPSDNDSPLPPSIFPTEGFKIIDSSTPVEEETLPFYRPELFYPVRLGEVFQNRYQVVAKLGYGASSTVWLGHDLIEQRYVALKIFVNRIPRNPELEVLQHLESIQSEHNGREFMRLLEASFQSQSLGGLHDVFVLRPLGLSLQALQRYQPNRVLYENVATSTAQCALIALNFLHEEAKVVYTDLHSGNLLLGISNESLLAQYEQNELEKPTPRKILANRVIHVSQISFNVGKVPHLCDFGHARICINGQLQQGRAMPIQYRTPEMLLDMPWDYSVDLWALALTIWDMLEPEPLFKVYNHDSSLNEAFHLAHMVALLGPPPLDFLKRSATSAKYWDDDGKWKGSVPIPSPTSLESRFTQFDGERKTIFLDFIRKLLAWDPQQRPSSGDAYMHPWLAEVRGEGDDS